MQGEMRMPSAVRDQAIEQIEQAVYMDTFAAAPPTLLQQPPKLIHDAGAMWGIAAGIEAHGWSGFFNQVLGLGLAAPATQTLVDTILASYRNARIPFIVNLSPHALALQLPQWLQQHNLVQQHWLAQCYRSIPSPPAREPTTLFDIQRIDSANAMRFVQIAAIGLPPALQPWIAALVGRAGWYHYLAYRDGVVVAGAALLGVLAGSFVASLYLDPKEKNDGSSVQILYTEPGFTQGHWRLGRGLR
jgi:hypothetical protein